jgi:long-chain fatty acid transport protein
MLKTLRVPSECPVVTRLQMKHAIAVAISVLLAMPILAAAQDFYAAGISAEAGRRAGIYSNSSNNAADALTLNPAGLTTLTGPTVDLSVTGIFARGSFANASNRSVSNDGSPMASNYSFVPFGAIGGPLGKHWAAGFGIAPDMLSASRWHYADTPGYAGVDYGPQSEKSQIIGIRAAGGIAYRFSDRLSAGVSVGGDYNSNTLDAPYIFQSHPVLAGLKTLLDLNTTGYGWNASFGFQARPSKRLSLAASFRTPTSITSHGNATGNMGHTFQALGLAAQPNFGYKAQVSITLPPSALVSLGWQATQSVRLSFQTDWIGWSGAFHSLPVTLTDGSNNDINSLLGSSTIKDIVPLDWKDQVTFRGAVEKSLGERLAIGAGFLHANDPVPSSTLSPLTAAIMQNSLTTGVGWHKGRVHFAASYGFDFTAQQQVGNSALLYDEYSNSRTRIGVQAFTLSTGFML